MLSSPHQKLMLIINPTAGKNQARDHLFPMLDFFFRSGYQVTVFPTQAKGDATNYVTEFGRGYDRIVCSGGDGTFNEVAAGLMTLPEDERPMLGYVPAGTTNDFASTLGISPDMDQSMHQLIEGRPFHCDIGRFNDRYFTYVAAFGLFTEVSYETPQQLKNTLGHFAYILEGIRSLATIRSYHLQMEIDGEFVDDTFIYGQISNSTSIGGIMDIGPTGVQLDDGLFEVLLIKMPTNPIEMSEIIAALMSQKVEDCPHIYFRHAASIHVIADKPMSWTLDGESGGTMLQAHAEIVPHALSIMLAGLPNEKNLSTEVVMQSYLEEHQAFLDSFRTETTK